MRIIVISVLFTAMLTGCAGTTPIASLTLPPVTTIEGKITQIKQDGFFLKDDSGEIYVTAKPQNAELNVYAGDAVKIYGNLRSGEERIFDGYVIRKQSGEQIVIDNPSPHIGFVLQSSFKK